MTASGPEVRTVPDPVEGRPALRPLWARAVALVTSPRSVFEELEKRPAWFWATLLVSVFTLVIAYVIFEPVIYPHMMEQVQSRNLTSEQIARAESMYGGAGFRVLASLAGAAVEFGSIVVIGLVLFGVCSFLLGGKARPGQAIAVAAHASLVHIPRALLVLPVMLARRDPTVSLGPGVLFPASEAEGFAAKALAGFLSGLDLFTLWSLALCVLGMSVVSRLSAKQVGVALAATYLIVLALMSLVGAAFQQ